MTGSPRPATLRSRLAETGGYGVATVLLVATLIGTGLLGTGPVADAIGVALAVAALVVVLATATARGRSWLAIVAAAGALAVLAIALDPSGVGPVVGLAWLATAGIATVGLVGVAADLLGTRHVSPRMLAGTVCLYILAGYTFALVYAVIQVETGTPFFHQVGNASFADFLYFSFSTITTTGFGDVTAVEPSWRLLTVTEALVGQLYLVVIIGAMVGAGRLLALVEGSKDMGLDAGARTPKPKP